MCLQSLAPPLRPSSTVVSGARKLPRLGVTSPRVLVLCTWYQLLVVVSSPIPVLPTRANALSLMHEYTRSDSLRKHMLSVEAAMRAYAEKDGEDVER